MLTNAPLFQYAASKGALLYVAQQNSDKLSDDFLAWLPDNLHIWEAFCENAIRIKKRGFKHYSSRTIVEFLRHHTALQENPGAAWKINDHNVPYLARLFDLVHPEHAGLFEFRRTTKPKGAQA